MSIRMQHSREKKGAMRKPPSVQSRGNNGVRKTRHLFKKIRDSKGTFHPRFKRRNAGLDEAQAAIRIAGRSISHLRYADDTTITAEGEEELKSLLMNMGEESEKAGLKLNIQKTKFMASGPITSRHTDGETLETVTDFPFWGSRIAAHGHCSREIKRRLLLRRKAVPNLDGMLKSRDTASPTAVHLVRTMVFQWSSMDVRGAL